MKFYHKRGEYGEARENTGLHPHEGHADVLVRVHGPDNGVRVVISENLLVGVAASRVRPS